MPQPGEPLAAQAMTGMLRLRAADPTLHAMIAREQVRQVDTLAMIASASAADLSVLACEGSVLGNVTGEGYPAGRYHAGCGVVDEIEQLAIDRACAVFGARYANVQPHSGSTANQIVMAGLLRPSDVILAMDLRSGGHLSHGSPASVAGQLYRAVHYGTDAAGLIDYAEVRTLAETHRPTLIVCGASAYPRTIDFASFRAIADAVGAYLMADISHISGLVAAGAHPSPIDHAHVTTTSTYKQLYGPRGGLILLGRDADEVITRTGRTLRETIQHAVFPLVQGTPNFASIAAKARALDIVAGAGFGELARSIVANARALAAAFIAGGYQLVTGGTDNHMVLVDTGRGGMTGADAETTLESCGIVVNRNAVPGDTRGPRVTSGIRLGTNTLALRGMTPTHMRECYALIHSALTDESSHPRVRARVRGLARAFPLPSYIVPRAPDLQAHDLATAVA